MTMAKKKKFKTVEGWLRNQERELDKLIHGHGKSRIKEDVYWRGHLNNLLAQFEVIGRIGDQEKPTDGIKRLLKIEKDEARKKRLGQVDRWFTNSYRSSVFLGADGGPVGEIVGGKHIASTSSSSQFYRGYCIEKNADGRFVVDGHSFGTEEAAMAWISATIKSKAAPASVGYIYRGYSYADDGSGKYVITKDGKTIGTPQPSQEAARKRIEQEIKRRAAA
jgi:hypothetical protein